MKSRLPLAALALVLLASGSFGAPPAPPTERSFTLDAVAVACGIGDGICLAYDGALPGPTLDVNLGDTVHVTLVNRIAETIGALPGDAATKARLANASVSFHVHGTVLATTSDGLSSMMGAGFPDSYAAPGGSYTYTFRAAYNGTWHYHDHLLGADGMEGVARGLAGLLVVRSGGDVRPDALLDLHLVNDDLLGAPTASVAPGGSFELAGVVLGDFPWLVTLTDPAGVPVASLELGPGQSEHVVVAQALAGAYRWRAENAITGATHEGEVSVP